MIYLQIKLLLGAARWKQLTGFHSSSLFIVTLVLMGNSIITQYNIILVQVELFYRDHFTQCDPQTKGVHVCLCKSLILIKTYVFLSDWPQTTLKQIFLCAAFHGSVPSVLQQTIIIIVGTVHLQFLMLYSKSAHFISFQIGHSIYLCFLLKANKKQKWLFQIINN